MKYSFASIGLLFLLVVACKNSNAPIEHSGAPQFFSYKSIDVSPTKFSIANNRDTLLFSPNGLIIYVPAFSFVLPQQGVPVDIVLKEYTNPSDILAQNISNQSQEQELMVANSIIHLAVEQQGKPVNLAPHHDLRLHFKRNKANKDIVLWRGEPLAWSKLPFDHPKLFSHFLRMGRYRKVELANGKPLRTWEKENLSMTKEDEERLWEKQKYIFLDYTITKEGNITNLSFREKVDKAFERKIWKSMKAHPPCVPFKQNGKAIDTKCEYHFHVHQAEPKYRNDAPYLDILHSGYAELKAKNIDHIDKLELKYHIFNIGRLGWIAAAKTMPSRNLVDIKIPIKQDFIAEVKAFLEQSKTIVKGTIEDGHVLFKGVPNNEPIQIVGFGEKDKQPLFASIKAANANKVAGTLAFSNSSYDKIKAQLQQLNN